MTFGNDVSDREGEMLRVFYALYGHVDSFGIVRSGVDRGEPLADGSSDTVYAS